MFIQCFQFHLRCRFRPDWNCFRRRWCSFESFPQSVSWIPSQFGGGECERDYRSHWRSDSGAGSECCCIEQSDRRSSIDQRGNFEGFREVEIFAIQHPTNRLPKSWSDNDRQRSWPRVRTSLLRTPLFIFFRLTATSKVLVSSDLGMELEIKCVRHFITNAVVSPALCSINRWPIPTIIWAPHLRSSSSAMPSSNNESKQLNRGATSVCIKHKSMCLKFAYHLGSHHDYLTYKQ